MQMKLKNKNNPTYTRQRIYRLASRKELDIFTHSY